MITIKEHKQAVKETNKLFKIRETKNSKFKKEERNIEDRYYKLEQNLRDKKRKETDRIYKKENKFNGEMEEQSELPLRKRSGFP